MKKLAKSKENAGLEEKSAKTKKPTDEVKVEIETNKDETSEKNTESRDQNADFEKELADEKDKYLRLAAEYDNYRKRSAKERDMTYNDARADAITKLLPVYDNLERALNMECADEAYYKGVEMIMTQLNEILEGIGVKKIPAVGEQFDPNRHNAVMTIENPELGEKTIAEEFQKGFTLGERVIRFSTVVVAN
jgi:molecular chaperone GrpE